MQVSRPIASSPIEEGFGHRPVGCDFPGRFLGPQRSDADWIPGEREPPLGGERDWIPSPWGVAIGTGYLLANMVPPGALPQGRPPPLLRDLHIRPVF